MTFLWIGLSVMLVATVGVFVVGARIRIQKDREQARWRRRIWDEQQRRLEWHRRERHR